jgi:hypothetical protein
MDVSTTRDGRSGQDESAHERRDQDESADQRPDQDESAHERANRELIELLNEIRVALPGVQVLFAFLLTLPFTQRFAQLDPADRRVYFAAVLATASATLCLIAPGAHHRLRFRDRVKEHLLHVANAFVLAGLAFLAFAVTAVTYLITDVIYPGALPRLVAGVLAGAFVLAWFVVPLLYRPERTPEAHPPDDR